MMGTNWMFKVGAAVTIVGAIAVAAYTTLDAQGGGRQGRNPGFVGPPPFGGPMGGRGPMGGPLGDLRALGLTEAQRAQVRQIMNQHREQTRALHEKSIAARKALRAAIDTDTIDEAAIRARSAEAGAIDADLAVAEAHLRRAVLQVLTPEQQEKARELRARRPQRMANRLQARRDRLERLGERIRRWIDPLR